MEGTRIELKCQRTTFTVWRKRLTSSSFAIFPSLSAVLP
ncbi:uncharacterized protein G2W53_043634 [Senna tora]|uniref:Uncharacterized protein n=1 Tax=Senna tora TaxID=362788 RepID=A0A834SL24_9FABA|nr:uncharacterized protein G2W53_043634 [Senna tora]